MPARQVDPARLEGDALSRWYRRSPQEIERERELRAAQRRDAFFGPSLNHDDDQEAKGSLRRLGGLPDVAFVDRRGAGPDDEGQFIEVGNPENRKLKQQYIQEYGLWPKAVDGRDFDVAHIKAIADGGTNTLDNIRPMDPIEHKKGHIEADDFKRWSARQWIARAFGGKVEPPAHAPRRGGGPKVRGFGSLGMLSGITGMLSGRIRTDNFDNFASDMMGLPSAEDYRKASERFQKQLNPKWKPGDPEMI